MAFSAVSPVTDISCRRWEVGNVQRDHSSFVVSVSGSPPSGRVGSPSGMGSAVRGSVGFVHAATGTALKQLGVTVGYLAFVGSLRAFLGRTMVYATEGSASTLEHRDEAKKEDEDLEAHGHLVVFGRRGERKVGEHIEMVGRSNRCGGR